MEYDVKRINSYYDFFITGASYIGAPQSNTVMFITKKVEHLLHTLDTVRDCLIFIQQGIRVPDEMTAKHCFVFDDNPQLAYARFSLMFDSERREWERRINYIRYPENYYVSATAQIGENAYIEPGCLIGHDVVIGSNARILAGTVIKNAVIGDDFLANEYAVIGSAGFTMAEDESGNKLRIASLGRVRIGNHVEIGAHDNISCGSAGDTVIEDYVKIDALVHIGHDAHLMKNTEITAGAVIGGFVRTGEKVYVGINSVVRNRIDVGNNAVVGMGATVTKHVQEGMTVVGNPARVFMKEGK